MIDWDDIEVRYCVVGETTTQIARALGARHTEIQAGVQERGWTRASGSDVEAWAREHTPVCVDASPANIAAMQAAQRGLLGRARAVVSALVDECAIEAFADPAQTDVRPRSLSERIKTARMLAGAIETITAAERKAYGIVDAAPGSTPAVVENIVTVEDRRKLAQRVVFMLAEQAQTQEVSDATSRPVGDQG